MNAIQVLKQRHLMKKFGDHMIGLQKKPRWLKAPPKEPMEKEDAMRLKASRQLQLLPRQIHLLWGEPKV